MHRSQLWRSPLYFLTGNYGKVTPDILRKFIYARGARLNNLLLSNCHVANRDVLVAVARTCLYLVDLDLSNCHVLDTGIMLWNSQKSAIDGLKFFLFKFLLLKWPQRGLQHSRPDSLKKSRQKKLVKSNKSISRNFF